MSYKIFEYDPQLLSYEKYIMSRMQAYFDKKAELADAEGKLYGFADRHEYFGIHKTADGWVYREWAPAADKVFFTGDMVDWDFFALEMTNIGDGVWELYLPTDMLYNGCHVKTIICKDAGVLERIPLFIRRSEQDPDTLLWSGIVTDEPEYEWRVNSFAPCKKGLCIYECHIGMAQEKEGIGTYREFIDNVLPRIKALGYNAIQIMAVMEHPYYGSFGYQVSSFFASSFRYGTPNGLKELIDTAHAMGITVLLDLVHSHAVKNTLDGINEFDGTTAQFFHQGERGEHPAWGTKLFDYGKNDVIRFLLSNLRFWMEEYRFDGFRFDGVTSMIYRDHGLGVSFDSYDKYFSDNTDEESLVYLMLANDLIREISPDALTVAEDMSAMPGMCLPVSEGGVGFDYRLAMGHPDLWIKLAELPDEAWSMEHIWYELTNRRQSEKSIAYVESHDQALVGDQTFIFRLCGAKMYDGMEAGCGDAVIARGVALHKLARMVTMTAGGEGYLNFMGNEFGHPEWIDFPREGNNWSYSYCRRQWSLADASGLKFSRLNNFDKALLETAKKYGVFDSREKRLHMDDIGQVMMYECGGLTCIINFTPHSDYCGYWAAVPEKGCYKIALSTDEPSFDGFGRIDTSRTYTAILCDDGKYRVQIDLPARTGVCLAKL